MARGSIGQHPGSESVPTNRAPSATWRVSYKTPWLSDIWHHQKYFTGCWEAGVMEAKDQGGGHLDPLRGVEVRSAADYEDDLRLDSLSPSPERKREHSEEDSGFAGGGELGAKRRALDEAAVAAKQKPNPFARKLVVTNTGDPFAREPEGAKSLHQSECFFAAVEAAETGAGKRIIAIKANAKGKDVTCQTTPSVYLHAHS